jgi:hypothetical protein
MKFLIGGSQIRWEFSQVGPRVLSSNAKTSVSGTWVLGTDEYSLIHG